MNTASVLALLAILVSAAGLLLSVMNYQPANSMLVLRNRAEDRTLRERDKRHHRVSLAGFTMFGVGIILQLVAFFRAP
ncbi:MAG: hypothetical protein WAU70_14780 [Flavobacteriales bacterium]